MCEQKGNHQIWGQSWEKRGRWEAGSCGSPGEAKGQGVDEDWGQLGENRFQSQTRTKNPPAALPPRPHIPPTSQGRCPPPAPALFCFPVSTCLITTQSLRLSVSESFLCVSTLSHLSGPCPGLPVNGDPGVPLWLQQQESVGRGEGWGRG